MPNSSFARARPKKLRVQEEYSYQFVVGSNPSAELLAPPKGNIEAFTPFDGYLAFTRGAIADVSTSDDMVQIGNLLLLSTPDPDLPPPDLNAPLRPQKPEVFPLKVLLPGSSKDVLSSDQSAARYFTECLPKEPTVRPLKIDVKVYDEQQAAYGRIFTKLKEASPTEQDTAQAAQVVARAAVEEAAQRAAREAVAKTVEALRPNRASVLQQGLAWLQGLFRPAPPPTPEKAVAKEEETELDARQQLHELATFEKGVVVVFSLEVTWPSYLEKQVQAMVLRRARVIWPHPVPHPTNIRLLIGERGHAERPGHWRFNPATQALEWDKQTHGAGGEMKSVPITALPPIIEEGTLQLRYKFPVMALRIDSPLDLYGQDELKAEFDIEVQGALLSGRLPRLFDASGQPLSLAMDANKDNFLAESVRALSQPIARVLDSNGNQSHLLTAVRTLLKAKITVVLNDAFARRHFTPRWRLVFQGVRFDSVRFDDLKRTLADLLFQIDQEYLLERPEPGCLLLAHREQPEYADKMELLVHCQAVDLAVTQREMQIAGGIKLVTPISSGDLEINLYGSARGDDRYLQEVFNKFALLLKQRLTSVASLR